MKHLNTIPGQPTYYYSIHKPAQSRSLAPLSTHNTNRLYTDNRAPAAYRLTDSVRSSAEIVRTKKIRLKKFASNRLASSLILTVIEEVYEQNYMCVVNIMSAVVATTYLCITSNYTFLSATPLLQYVTQFCLFAPFREIQICFIC